MYKALLTCLLVFGILVSPAAAEPKEEKKQLKIGVIFSLSGFAQIWSKSARQGAQLSLEHYLKIHPDGPLAPSLIFEDGKTDTKSVVSAWKKLVEIDKVDIVVGDVWAYLTNPLIPLADSSKKILISPTVLDEAVEKKSPYFFTIGAKVNLARLAIDAFFDLNPDVKSVSILYWDDQWGKAYLAEWRASAKAHSVSIFEEIGINDFAHDYRSEITKIAKHKPDALIVSHLLNQVLKRAQEQNLKFKYLSTNTFVEALTQGLTNYEMAEGVYFADWISSPQFQAAYFERFGEEPILEAQSSYDAVHAILKAYAMDFDHPLKALSSLSFVGTTGPLDFSKGMSANYSSAQLRQVKGGKIVTVFVGETNTN